MNQERPAGGLIEAKRSLWVALAWPLAGLMVIAAGASNATEPAGWYGGLTLSHPQASAGFAGTDKLPGSGDAQAARAADRDPGYAAHLGYGFHNGFSLEAGYIEATPGDPRGRTLAPSIGTVGSAVRAPGLNVNVLGRLPVARDLAVFGKLGLLIPDKVGDAGGPVSLSDRVNRSLPGVGLGLNYSLTSSLGLRAQWEMYHRPGADFAGRSGIDQLSVGVDLRFR